VLRKKRDEMTGEWRILHSLKLFELYSSSDSINVIKWMRMRRQGMWHIEERREVRTEL
jgi:hypothetical protein